MPSKVWCMYLGSPMTGLAKFRLGLADIWRGNKYHSLKRRRVDGRCRLRENQRVRLLDTRKVPANNNMWQSSSFRVIFREDNPTADPEFVKDSLHGSEIWRPQEVQLTKLTVSRRARCLSPTDTHAHAIQQKLGYGSRHSSQSSGACR